MRKTRVQIMSYCFHYCYGCIRGRTRSQRNLMELKMNSLEPHSPRPLPRRRFNSVVLLAALAASGLGGLLGSRPVNAQLRLRPTPTDFEGPFRPVEGTNWGGIDLMKSRDAVSPGKPVVLAGRLLDTAGRPYSGLRLQVWQANSTGRYDYHPAETPGHGRPDPAFRGHGESDIDADGWYAYRTIRPGGYKRTLFGFLPWTFVPHIHVAVRAGERDLLVTQCDLDKAVVQQPATAQSDHAELMRSAPMRRLAEAVGGAVVAQAELIRFDVVLDRPA
jgi:protocatechuate 3,4-dioxygenase beta subunit